MTVNKRRGSGNLTIRQLEVFTVASRSSTFSEAASRLGISQPTLSSMVAKIESLSGLRLFDRTTRTLALTTEGDRLSVVANDLVHNFQNSLASIHDTAKRRGGHLSMAVLPSVASAIAPRAIQRFLETYPDLNIALHDTTRQDGLVWVLDRVVDFGILSDAPTLSELRREKVYVDHFQVVCNATDELASRKSLSWKDIESLPFVLTGTVQVRKDIEAAWLRDGANIRPRFAVQNIMPGLALVSEGLGITILPRVYQPSIRAMSLVSIPLSGTALLREIEIVRRMDRQVTPAIGHMLECFKAVFTEFDHESPSSGTAVRRRGNQTSRAGALGAA